MISTDSGRVGREIRCSVRAVKSAPVPAPGSRIRTTGTFLSNSEAMNLAIGAGVKNCPIAERSTREVAWLNAFRFCSMHDRASTSVSETGPPPSITSPLCDFIPLTINKHDSRLAARMQPRKSSHNAQQDVASFGPHQSQIRATNRLYDSIGTINGQGATNHVTRPGSWGVVAMKGASRSKETTVCRPCPGRVVPSLWLRGFWLIHPPSWPSRPSW